MLLQVFADNLRQMRTEKGIKQVDFATRVGCKQTMVSRWEKGKALPKEDQIEKMAHALQWRYNIVGVELRVDRLRRAG